MDYSAHQMDDMDRIETAEQAERDKGYPSDHPIPYEFCVPYDPISGASYTFTAVKDRPALNAYFTELQSQLKGNRRNLAVLHELRRACVGLVPQVVPGGYTLPELMRCGDRLGIDIYNHPLFKDDITKYKGVL